MDEVIVRNLRNQGVAVLQPVAAGVSVTMTVDGVPIAESRPVAGRGVASSELLRRWRGFPELDAGSLRADLDVVVDATL